LSDAPFLLVVAGPNGSGKSTLTDYLINSGIDFGDYINADRIAATLRIPEPARSKQAQTIADFQRDQCLRGHVNFSFETVMSHPSKVDFMVRADDAGYQVTLYFVCTSDPDINVRRVQNRVLSGGHDVPQNRIIARYGEALDCYRMPPWSPVVPCCLITARWSVIAPTNFCPTRRPACDPSLK
jgi:predicted ABC-type ATPase